MTTMTLLVRANPVYVCWGSEKDAFVKLMDGQVRCTYRKTWAKKISLLYAALE